MYQNAYGERISSKVFDNDKKYIQHLNSEMTDSFQGSGMHTNASKCPCGCIPCQCMRPESEGCGMSGGSGYARATVRDMGFEPTIGAGAGKGSKTYRKQGCGQIAALPPPENVFALGNVGAGMAILPDRDEMAPMPDRAVPDPKLKRVVGGRKRAKTHVMPDGSVMLDSEHKTGKGTKEIKDDLAKFDFNRLKDYIGLGKPKELADFKRQTGLRGKGFEELKSDLRKFDANRIKDYVGLGRYGKKFMKGSGFFDSIANFFKQFPEKINSVLMPIAGKISETVGKVKGAVGLGRGTAELKADLGKFDMNRLKDYIGLGKGRNVPQKVVERSVMQPVIGAGSSGGGDGRKARAEIVKKVMKQRGISMIEASKIVKSEGLYKK
jgi:hypothetical protein